MFTREKFLVIDREEAAVSQFHCRRITEIPVRCIIPDDPVPLPALAFVVADTYALTGIGGAIAIGQK